MLATQGERACRSVNIIFLTDGDEDCDLEVINGKTAAEDAAARLFAGFTRPHCAAVGQRQLRACRT